MMILTKNNDRSPGGSPLEKVAVSSWAWAEAYYAGQWSLLDLPATAVAAGFTTIECNDFMLPPPRFSRLRQLALKALPGAPPELWRYSQTNLRRLRDGCRVVDAAVIAWTINSDFTVPAHHWPAQKLYLRRGLSAARLLAAPLLRVNLGGAPETPRERDELTARRLAEFVSYSQRLYPGVVITLENHWGVSADIDRHLQIFDAAASQLPPSLRDKFGCCFDPANMPIRPERPRWQRELAARANHYHWKRAAVDEDGRERPLPHAELQTILKEAGYAGWITVEANPSEIQSPREIAHYLK
jgi:sugar phosphate isomerase/epimerase